MESGTNEWALSAILFLLGIVPFVGGVLLYTNKFVGLLVLDNFMPGKPSLATTFLGAWLLLMAPSEFVLQTGIDALIVPYGIVLLGCLAIGLMGWFWMPRFMQPRWMKEGDKVEARGEDLFTKRFSNGERKSMTTDADGFSHERMSGVLVPRPQGWEMEVNSADMLVVAHPPVPRGIFRPNMVLRWAPANGISLARYATAALASTLQTAQQVRIISHETWPMNGSEGPVRGRRQRFVHQVEQHPVCVDRWLWISGHQVFEATASYTVDQHAGMKLLFEQMIMDLRIEPANAAADGQERDAIDTFAPTEPRLDETASRLAGEDREDLGALAAAQPCQEPALLLRIPALELMDSLADRNRLGMFQRKGPEFTALREAGFLAADGSLTPAGTDYGAPLRTPVAAFQVTAADERGGAVLQAWIGGGCGRVTAEPSRFSRPSARVPGPDDLSVQVLQANAVPKAIADWLGFSPAWSIAHEPVVLARDQYEAKVKSARARAPIGLSEAARRMWQQPWTEWEILDERTGGWFGFVNAGTAGQYRLGRGDGGSVILEPVSSAAVWDTLVRFIHASVEGTPLWIPELPGFDERPADGRVPEGKVWAEYP
ncbi:hypothetical protein LOC59_03365 [Arthrobacter sp. zg-Y916]|uniref:hypothetical protein n=1 Tax=Arthrobacter sp. zg-Y916 TaxID=2894190 RepID=UPI001E363D0D|nr:hypothetical protein [Arthrobacter sp. zg-Y916]MCC9192694.1 hypothetical protein [Arthrobacter sp. zg-Y916]